MIKHFSLRFSLFLLVMDAVLITLALWIATAARMVLPYGLPQTFEGQRVLPLPVFIIAIIVHTLIYSMMNVHSPRQVATLLRELQVTIAAATIALLMLLGALYMSFRDVSRLQMGYFFAAHIALIIASRVVLRVTYLSRGDRRTTRNVLIIGSNGIAQQMYELVRDHAYTGLHALGIVPIRTDDTPENTPIIGQLDQLPTIIADCQVSEVIIALDRDTPIHLPELVRSLQALPVNIRLVPQYTDLAFLQVHIEDFSGMPLLTLKEPVFTPYQRLLKRLFDMSVTLVLLVPMLPVMGVIALLIRRDSPGPILFRQQRVGEGGKPFEMMKFRTMVVGAEWQQELVMRYDEHGNAIYKHPDDPRVTRIGRFLRVTSLDELPQLLNILRGEMSLVGPRPELPELVDRYQPWQRKRFEVPQGLTGWWQINGRANKPMHLSTEDDLFYIRNYSLGLDLRILWRTVWVVLSRRGAY
jgi:exopolysaccharide biosynthesis polyprenyl glycosylphosphotransferase